MNPYSLNGRNVAVFMSTSFNETEKNMFNPNIPRNVLTIIGANRTMTSNRISFAFNLTGKMIQS